MGGGRGPCVSQSREIAGGNASVMCGRVSQQSSQTDLRSCSCYCNFGIGGHFHRISHGALLLRHLLTSCAFAALSTTKLCFTARSTRNRGYGFGCTAVGSGIERAGSNRALLFRFRPRALSANSLSLFAAPSFMLPSRLRRRDVKL